MTDGDRRPRDADASFGNLQAGVVGYAASMERAAIAMMRASRCALECGDPIGAQREQTIAAREFQWAAGLWSLVHQRLAADRCRDAHDAVLLGTWTEPVQEQE